MAFTLVLDESGQQVSDRPVCVGAVTCTNYSALEERLRELHAEWSQDERFVGLQSFEHFVDGGFHNNQIPLELQLRFIDLLESTPQFRLSVSYSRRGTYPTLDDNQLCLVLYARLLRDIFLRKGVRHFDLLFETNEALNPKFDRLVEDSLRFAAKRAPQNWTEPSVAVQVVTKQDSLTLGVVDFALKIVSDWVVAGKPTNVKAASYRNYSALKRRFSIIEDLDMNERISRHSRD